jgi:CcmD family protein
MTVDTYPDLFWAYTAVWTILAVYIGLLGVRLKRIERSLGSPKAGSAHNPAQNYSASCERVDRQEVAGCCDSKR